MSPTSDHDAHFANFRGKVTFSKSATFWRWKRLSKGTGIPPENILGSRIFLKQHFTPNVAEKNFVAGCDPPNRQKTAFFQFEENHAFKICLKSRNFENPSNRRSGAPD